MNLRQFLGFSLIAWAPLSMANLVVNGDFEGLAFTGYTVSSQGLPGWTVVGNNATDQVFVFPPTPGFGPQTDALDLSGFTDLSGQGVEQSVATLAGETYRLTFDYWAGRLFGPSLPGSIDVFVNGTQIVDELSSGDDLLPRTYTYDFVASGPTLLRFLTGDVLTANDIDNVSVLRIPEPSTLGLLGLGVLALLRKRRLR